MSYNLTKFQRNHKNKRLKHSKCKEQCGKMLDSISAKTKFVKSTSIFFSLVKTLLSRNFWSKKCDMTVNFRNFHTVNFWLFRQSWFHVKKRLWNCRNSFWFSKFGKSISRKISNTLKSCFSRKLSYLSNCIFLLWQTLTRIFVISTPGWNLASPAMDDFWPWNT